MSISPKYRRLSCICGDKSCAIPFGFCHCGCGEKTLVAIETATRYKAIKGMPKVYVLHHHLRLARERWPTESDPLVRHLSLGKGNFAVVDANKFRRLDKFRYFAHVERGRMYAMRSVSSVEGGVNRRDFIRLHWDVLKRPADGQVVDHINRDGLDNREANLRICSGNDNGHNHRLHKRNTSGHPGVRFDRRRQTWAVTIGVDGRNIYLGSFRKHQKQKAIDCRIEAEKKYYGDFTPEHDA